MKYRVVLRQSEEGYSVSCPQLPGCWSQGDTEAEALQNIRDAIAGYLEEFGDQLASHTVRELEVTV